MSAREQGDESGAAIEAGLASIREGGAPADVNATAGERGDASTTSAADVADGGRSDGSATPASKATTGGRSDESATLASGATAGGRRNASATPAGATAGGRRNASATPAGATAGGRRDGSATPAGATAGARGAPIAHDERIVALDALRGFALLGIVLINVMIFSHGFWNMAPLHQRYTERWHQAALALNGVLVAGKANSLFSFLFGVGFALQLRRLDDGRARGVSIYLRRLAVLFAFGLAHALLVWSGDVLHHYAVLGLVLLALRKVPRRWLFALIVAAFLVPQGVRLYRTATSTPEARAEREAFVVQMRARANAAYAGGSYVEAVKVRAAETKSLTVGRPLEGLNWLMSLTVTILLGLHFGRERLIERAAELGPFWARLQRWSFGLGLGSGLLAAACGWNLRPGQPTMLGFASGLFFELSRPTLMLFYASTIVRFCVRRPHAPWLATVAAAGRMPLTNYLMQSVLCTLIFYGYGLGLYGKTPPLTFLAIAAAVWGLEVVWSRWWLRHFLFGPAEWLWRALSYGAWLPARRRAPAGAE